MVYREGGKGADLVDLSAYRERKLERMARASVESSIRFGEAEQVSPEESQLRLAIRLHVLKDGQRNAYPAWMRAAIALGLSCLIAVLLLVPSEATPALPQLFTAVALLIPLLYEGEYMYAFLAYTLPLAVASLLDPPSQTTAFYICFGAYALLRNAIGNRFFRHKAVFWKLCVLALPTALLVAANACLAWGLWIDKMPSGTSPDLYSALFAGICLAIFGGLELSQGVLWRVYAEMLRPRIVRFSGERVRQAASR